MSSQQPVTGSHNAACSTAQPLTRWLWVVCGVLLLCTACSRHQLTPEEQAANVAAQCYRALYKGNTEEFLNGREHAAALPNSYRHQLQELLSLHVRQVERAHRGVTNVEVARTAPDTTLQLMQVFLTLTYGDSTSEEIVVPMVEQDGQWVMK